MADSPENAPLLAILSDQPAGEDELGFASYAKTLADIVADPGPHTPLTIRVSWGLGPGQDQPDAPHAMTQSRLQGTLDWPGIEQVFHPEHRLVLLWDGMVPRVTTYTVSRLTGQEAEAACRLEIGRAHWGVDSDLHDRGGETLHEDSCP